MDSIYNDPQKYAETVSCSLEIAQKRCEYFKKLEQKIRVAQICPECGNMSLFIGAIDTDDYFSNSQQKVICKECHFVSNVTYQFECLKTEYEFDLVLFSYKCKEIFSPWDQFVVKDTENLES